MPRNQHDIDPARDAEIYAAYVEAGNSGRALARTGRYGGKMGILSAVRRHKATQGEAYGAGGIGQGAERDGHAPYIIKGVSTYFDADGNQRAQWVKTRLDDEQRQEAIRQRNPSRHRLQRWPICLISMCSPITMLGCWRGTARVGRIGTWPLLKN